MNRKTIAFISHTIGSNFIFTDDETFEKASTFASPLCIAEQLYLYYYLDSKAAKSSSISFYIPKPKSDNFSTFHNIKEIQLNIHPARRQMGNEKFDTPF